MLPKQLVRLIVASCVSLACAAPGFALTPEQQRLQAAWNEYCDRLKSSGERLLAPDTGDPLDTAEGFRYLAMLAAMTIDRAQYADDPVRPVLVRALDGYRKFSLDASDNSYRVVHFEPGGEYVIRGTRGNSTCLGVQVNRDEAAVANIHQAQMQFACDGIFELYLGGPRRDTNWIALHEGANGLYVREIFVEWDAERPSTMWLERLDRVEAAAPLDAEAVAADLRQAADALDRNLVQWNGYVSRLRAGARNAFRVPRGTAAEGGSPDNLYSGGSFALAPDEALVVETDVVPTRLWSVQLGNAWFQSLDYQYRQTSLNSVQAKPDADGVYREVVAHRDPGFANWLDTAGHGEGIVHYRWNGAQTAPGAPRTRVVEFAELGALLPHSPRIDAATRAETLHPHQEQRYRHCQFIDLEYRASRHVADQLELHLDFRFKHFPMSREEVTASAESVYPLAVP